MKKMANKDLRVKELCKLRGITLEELANRLGIRRTSLAQAMSRNSFSTDKLSDIADVLGVGIPELFADESRQADAFLAIIKDGDRCYTAHSVDELQKVTDEIKKNK